jgi:hypothetical protein
MKHFKAARKYAAKKINAVKVSLIGLGGIIFPAVSHAALDLTGVTVDTTDYITMAEFIVVALVAFWGIRKGLSLLGR